MRSAFSTSTACSDEPHGCSGAMHDQHKSVNLAKCSSSSVRVRTMRTKLKPAMFFAIFLFTAANLPVIASASFDTSESREMTGEWDRPH